METSDGMHASPSSDERAAMRAIVRGRVQLVMFRDFTQRTARRLRLVGYVRNHPDGTVEVAAEGTRAALEKLLAALHRGSLLSRVDGVVCEWRAPSDAFDDFKIAYADV